MNERIPKHPCPLCGGVGRQTSQYRHTAYFACGQCEQAFSETMLPGGRIEIAFRARIIRSDGNDGTAVSNSMYLGVA